jgi:sugar phosphate isomerase/epimerase
MEYVKEINPPAFQCLVDSYPFWKDGDSLEDLRANMKWIAHVHVADVAGRVPPGESGPQVAPDYRAFFNVLKGSNYDGLISVESPDWTDYHLAPKRIIDFLNRQWREA